MQLRSLFLALGLTVVSCAPTSNQIAQRYNSFNPERAINHSQTIIDSVHDGNPAMDADDKEQEREFFGHGIDSFQEGDVLRFLSKKNDVWFPKLKPVPVMGTEKENHTSWERYYRVSDCSSSSRNNWYLGR